MKIFRLFWAAVALLACLSAQADSQPDFQSGLEAIASRDFAAALSNFRPLAEQGNAAAQVNMGNLYMKGLGVSQDYEAAAFWYRKAADQGERIAQSKLGILYYHGLGVDKNLSLAAQWFQKAADQGVVSAQSILGTLYAEGDGVAQDLAQAFYWYTMAAEQGDADAAKGRQSLEEDMTPGQHDEALRRLSLSRKTRIEQEEKAFETATAGLGTPPAPPAAEDTSKPDTQPAPASGQRGKKHGKNKPAH